MAEENKKHKEVDVNGIFRQIAAKKKLYLIVFVLTAILSAVWIFPQPRYYNCEVSLAPETAGEDVGGGLSSIASSFGVNLGNSSNDAIYPTLYPDLFESPQFIVSLFGIKVKDIDNTVNCDYYTYLAKHQKQNVLTLPFKKMMKSIVQAFSSKPPSKPGTGKDVNPFMMSKFDNELVDNIKSNIKCSVDKKTEVISISVQDQDPLICATLADSIREHLQAFIIEYRTHKARIDVKHYKELTDSANLEYRSAVNEYAQFCDANQDITLQSQMSKRDELENEMQMKYNTYQAMETQYEAMKAKLQERTPAFTTLKSATVPIKPAGPKRMMFIIGMLFLTMFVTTCYVFKKNIKSWAAKLLW